MKMSGPGASRNTVPDGAGSTPGWRGQSTVRCKESVPDKSVPISGVSGRSLTC